MAVILGKHQSTIYREFSRNGSGGVYTGNEAQKTSEQRRRDNKPSPKIGGRALMNEITALFKKDLSPDQISGRLRLNTLTNRKNRLHPRPSTSIYIRKRRKTPRSKFISEANFF
jgi:IS30 family transposase